MSTNKVYIIIVNWNGWRDTIECLESVFRSDYPDFRVIVCDNGSTDDSLGRIKEWAAGLLLVAVSADSPMCMFSSPSCSKPVAYAEYQRAAAESGGDPAVDPPLVLINAGANLGFAGGNNIGMRYALVRGDFSYVWLLNNDTVIDRPALSAMVLRMQHKSDAGMCGSTIRYYSRPEKVQALGGGWHCKWIGLPWHYGRYGLRTAAVDARQAESHMNYVEGASLLVSKPFLLDVGLMCEDYFLYFEETDWAIRARGRYTLAYAPESVVYHKVGGSLGTSSNPLQKSYCCDYYNVRNRLFFTRRFYPEALPTIYLALMGTLLCRLITGKWVRVKMIVRTLADYNTDHSKELPKRAIE